MTATAPREHQELVASMTGAMVRPVEKFAGSARLRPDGRPKAHIRAELRRIPNGRNTISCAYALVAPVIVIVAVAAIGRWWATALAVPVIGTLQMRMNILHHEAAHRLLFSNRRVNDIVGINTMGWLPLGTGDHGYRRVHSAHHRDEFGPNEPDFLLYSLYPITRRSFVRKLRRDGTGVSAFRIFKPRLRGLLASGQRISGLRMLGMQAVIFAAFALAGVPWLYVWLWVLPWMTWYQVINRLRAISEHAGMTQSSDRRETTHIVLPSLWSRTFMAPLNVSYHLPHHVDSGIPMRHLPALQQILIEDGYVPDNLIWPSYLAMWRAATGRAA